MAHAEAQRREDEARENCSEELIGQAVQGDQHG
jgi:hypothetical protein